MPDTISGTTAYAYSVPMKTSSNDKPASSYIDSSTRLTTRRSDSQKVVTFYRESDSKQPALRIIIDSRKYLNLESLIEELGQILNLKDREKRIYSNNGKLLHSVDDFEDGGCYFFSFSAKDERFLQALSIATEESKAATSSRLTAKEKWKKILKGKTRLINVVTNEYNSLPWKVLIDETKLQSFSQLLHELNYIIQPREGRVFRLCTNKGRRVRGLSELFHGTDTFVAIVSSIGMDKDGQSEASDERETAKGRPRKIQMHESSKFDIITGQGSHLDRRVISVKGKCHVFDPPSRTEGLALQNGVSSRKAPEQKLQLSWIYGYNGQDMRDNIFVLKSEELAYCVASVVVIYDIHRQRQRYYAEHTMKITCMALHPNKWFVATGQEAPANHNVEVIDHIRIWNAEMLNTLAVLSLEEQNLSVMLLAFSIQDSGGKVACIDNDGHNQRMTIWDWSSKEVLATSPSYEEEELSLGFHPHSNRSLLTAGKNHIFYWSWREHHLEKYKGHFFACPNPDYVSCFAYLSTGDAVAGDSNGCLHIWPEGSRKHRDVIKEAHAGSIQALCVLSHDVLLTYGAGDKLLALWDTRANPRQPVATIKITGDHGDVTSIAVSPSHHDYSIGNTDFYLGTTKNRILQGTLKTQFKPIIKGHNTETTSLAANPCDNNIVTVGMDAHVIYRSVEDNSIVWEKEIEFPATSVAFYPYGNVVAVAMDSGRWCVLNSDNGHHVASFQCGNNALSAIAYSAEGGDIAIGTSTGEVYLFSVYDEGHSYRLIASVECRAAKIVALDWTTNGSHLRTLMEDWDQVILDTEKLKEVQDSQLIADMEWHSQNSTLSYATAGLWQPGSDLKFLSAATSVSGDLLCAGTQYGQLRVFSYPCAETKAKYREYSTHVGEIARVCFLPSELHLVSAGRYDNAVMQWRITLKKTQEIGVRGSYYREHTMEDQVEAKLTREKSSSLGHRRIRGSESRVSDSSSRLPLHAAKEASVEDIPDDYNKRQEKMDTEEMQAYLNESGTGLSQRDLALRKSKDFLGSYAVLSPITKEQKKKRQGKGP